MMVENMYTDAESHSDGALGENDNYLFIAKARFSEHSAGFYLVAYL